MTDRTLWGADRRWTMADERYFLDRAGSWASWECAARPDRRAVLRGYLASLAGREEWGELDREALETYVRGLLAEHKEVANA